MTYSELSVSLQNTHVLCGHHTTSPAWFIHGQRSTNSFGWISQVQKHWDGIQMPKAIIENINIQVPLHKNLVGIENKGLKQIYIQASPHIELSL